MNNCTQIALMAFQLLGGQRNNPAFLPERISSRLGIYKTVNGTHKTVDGTYKTVSGTCKTVNGTYKTGNYLPTQIALMAFQLLGGQRNNPAFLPERIPSRFEPGSKTNMFSYKGPRKVRAMALDEQPASEPRQSICR